MISKVESNNSPSPISRAVTAAFQPNLTKFTIVRTQQQFKRGLSWKWRQQHRSRCTKADLRYKIALSLSSDNMQTLADINNVHFENGSKSKCNKNKASVQKRSTVITANAMIECFLSCWLHLFKDRYDHVEPWSLGRLFVHADLDETCHVLWGSRWDFDSKSFCSDLT